MHDLITKILGGSGISPDAPGPDGRPAAYTVAEWQANECATLADARACRDYLTKWPEGPQGGMLPVARVAVILDLTRQAVQQQVLKRHILAAKIGGAHLIPIAEVERWKPVKAGRPRAAGIFPGAHFLGTGCLGPGKGGAGGVK